MLHDYHNNDLIARAVQLAITDKVTDKCTQYPTEHHVTSCKSSTVTYLCYMALLKCVYGARLCPQALSSDLTSGCFLFNVFAPPLPSSTRLHDCLPLES